MCIKTVYNKSLTAIIKTVQRNTSSDAIVSTVKRYTNNALLNETYNDYLNIGDSYITYDEPKHLLIKLNNIVESEDKTLTQRREDVRDFIRKEMR